ncbi:hypothetical protein B1H10_03960 [candidate division KSB1 bacterium 4484_188]|nr:MAG: hypothetical protein B1H10_03960 [candidate division KSB1 bacterium 4484_188]
MKNFGHLLFFVFILILSGIFCNPAQKEQNKSNPKYGGMLKISCLGSLEILDPQKIVFSTDLQVASLLYEGLVQFGEKAGNIEPCLAENWQILDRGNRLVFTLRDNVYFHDDPCFPGGKGRKLNAGDVLYSFQRIASAQGKCPNYYLFAGKIEGIDDFHQGKNSRISGIRPLNDRKIEFRLTKPYVNFLKILATQAAYIVPKEAVTLYAENFPQHPVGTGPFRLIQWKQLEALQLFRNTHYWKTDNLGQSLPYLDGLNILLISNPMISWSEFLKGNLHLYKATESSYLKLEKKPGFFQQYKIACKTEDFGIRFLGFSLDRATPFARKVEVRRAIARAFHRSELLPLKSNSRKLAESLANPLFLHSRNPKWYSFQPSRALHLIKGKKLPEINISSNILAKDVQVLKNSLEKIHFACTLNIRDVRYYRYIVQERPDIFRVSFQPSYPDPEEYYALFYSKSSPQINLTRYRNPKFDRLLERAMVEQDEAHRQKIFLQLEQILKADVPALYLTCPEPAYYLIPKNVHGLAIRFGIPDLSAVWMEQNNVP